jgi:hypothetical protein
MEATLERREMRPKQKEEKPPLHSVILDNIP